MCSLIKISFTSCDQHYKDSQEISVPKVEFIKVQQNYFSIGHIPLYFCIFQKLETFYYPYLVDLVISVHIRHPDVRCLSEQHFCHLIV